MDTPSAGDPGVSPEPAPVSGGVDTPEGADALPAYDPVRYCSMLSGLVQDSGEARRKCLLKEEEARIRLEGLPLPAELISECDSVARSMGGSYLVLLGCVEDTGVTSSETEPLPVPGP
ncbi:hypothetical protein IHV25_08235 [Phaeovibrio sulfidiphilus]|uniref:Uncharacterized protein n=1 Tax=Phaeovibrio sulfidiphilus TaxID=1220600 RepID=A0A8J6YWB2_9PROT|nr:hypothetical protein [Phaeovibrio sulfidiphilus]MBE1237634.1 hypothetical protein [Phaeovibrio sulfidiphilus]